MEFNDTAKRLKILSETEAHCAKKPIKQVAISEICESAGISKTTFYRLFHDKYEIALWAQSFVGKCGVNEVGRSLSIAEGVAITLKGIETFSHLYLETAHSQEFITADELARREYEDIMRETVRDIHGCEIDVELDFEIEWYSAMGREFAKGWLAHRDQGVSVDHAAEIFADCCPSRLRAILDNPVAPDNYSVNEFQKFLLAILG